MCEVVIFRGISGSGKSCLKTVLEEMCAEAGVTIAIHSTDDYHMVDGEYKFNRKQLGYFHSLNKKAFEKSIADGIDIVGCDNTNLKQREYKAYIEAGRAVDADVVAVVFHPDEYDKHVERNAHGVPEDVILHMMGTLFNNIETVGVDHEFVIFPEKFCDRKLRTIASRIIENFKRSNTGAQ
jgi:tRNA uridine 5-carbamoylmethylation protein Kti12